MTKVKKNYYLKEGVLDIAKDLIGKYLVTQIDGRLTSGIIVETEAYHAREKACHAYMNKRTPRTETMFSEGGIAYIYQCYGIHYLFNIVTNITEKAEAVLIRAIQPVEGIEIMLKRRRLTHIEPRLTAGPGVLTQALGISKAHNGICLTGNTIWLEDRQLRYTPEHIIASPRVGVDYAGKDAKLPWRFRLTDCSWCSK